MTAASLPVAETAPLGRWSRLARFAIELGPTFLVSLLFLPLVIKGGTLVPYEPNTIDLRVYDLAVRDMIAGKDIYLTSTPGDNLKFIYPPIAAILMTPLAFGSYGLWQVLWTLIGTWAQQSVLRRAGVPRGWVLGILGAVLVIAMEPLRTTMGYGQVNTMLMALVVADLLPSAPGERRVIPRGALTGLAAAIKLTPMLFVVFAVLIGRKAMAAVAVATFAVATGVGFLLMPAESMKFWRGLGQGEVNTAGPIYVGNQGMTGVFSRWIAEDRPSIVAGVLVGLLVAGLATLVATYWWRHGEKVFAVGLVGMATCLASPLSWTHHHVWAAVLLVAVVVTSAVPRWAQWTGLAWMVWVAACLPLAVLPYGAHVEVDYTAGQNLVGNLGPVLGSLLIVALSVDVVRRLLAARRNSTPAPAALPDRSR